MYSKLEIKKDEVIVTTGDAEFHPSTVNVNGRCYLIGLIPMPKPPLGLMPEWVWIEKRINEIDEAVKRYLEAGKEIPVSWVSELYRLKEQLSRYRTLP